jgi:hypothetical protein
VKEFNKLTARKLQKHGMEEQQNVCKLKLFLFSPCGVMPEHDLSIHMHIENLQESVQFLLRDRNLETRKKCKKLPLALAAPTSCSRRRHTQEAALFCQSRAPTRGAYKGEGGSGGTSKARQRQSGQVEWDLSRTRCGSRGRTAAAQ